MALFLFSFTCAQYTPGSDAPPDAVGVDLAEKDTNTVFAKRIPLSNQSNFSDYRVYFTNLPLEVQHDVELIEVTKINYIGGTLARATTVTSQSFCELHIF